MRDPFRPVPALLMGIVLIAGCGASPASPASASPIPSAPLSFAPTALATVSLMSTPTPSSLPVAAPIDPVMVQKFKAAFARATSREAQAVGLDVADWPAYQVALVERAITYEGFAADLEAIAFPGKVLLNGTTQDLGRDSNALIGWSKQLAVVYRQIAASASWETAKKDIVVFEGSSYPMESFLQDAGNEWSASLSLTAADLGVDL